MIRFITMSKAILSIILVYIIANGYSQEVERVSTVEMIEVLDNHMPEALYYYENNWKMLREDALKKGYIYAYQLLFLDEMDTAQYDLILITTYSNKQQYDLREVHFSGLIEQRGELKLLNDKQPGDFRKFIYSNENVRNLE